MSNQISESKKPPIEAKNITEDQSNSIRVNIIAALVALSIGALTMLRGNTVLGLEVVSGSFLSSVILIMKASMIAAIISGVTFMLTVGYFNGFHYDENYTSNSSIAQGAIERWHRFVFWLQKRAYDWTIGAFVFPFISIVYNVIAKLLGFCETTSIIIAAIISLIIVVAVVAIVMIEKRKSKLSKKSARGSSH